MVKKISKKEQEQLLQILSDRFAQNRQRHPTSEWKKIAMRLKEAPEKLYAIQQMETTGGEPDVVELKTLHQEIVFIDCAQESPKGRRSLCYDRAGLESRKEHQPKNTAIDYANKMGVQLLSEEEYRALQLRGEFDLKTSSWVLTPHSIRSLGGALFCDRRYDHIFTYHNGAQSYYASRAFRAKCIV
jgi:hypothetical protein